MRPRSSSDTNILDRLGPSRNVAPASSPTDRATSASCEGAQDTPLLFGEIVFGEARAEVAHHRLAGAHQRHRQRPVEAADADRVRWRDVARQPVASAPSSAPWSRLTHHVTRPARRCAACRSRETFTSTMSPGRIDPPEDAREAAGTAARTGAGRCSPAKAGRRATRVLGVADHPLRPPGGRPGERGALFDSTEIDEILTLRVMTMTDAEKAEARATDPRAAAIIDRCDACRPTSCSGCTASCGTRRRRAGPDRRPWWDPAAAASVSPETDTVVGRRTGRKGSRVRVHPAGAPTPRTCSSPTRKPGSAPCRRPRRGDPRGRHPRRRPGGASCTTGTAATSTSPRTSSNHSPEADRSSRINRARGEPS